jgi:hypothetical protein
MKPRDSAATTVMEREQPEWLDLKVLKKYACMSHRTLREAATNV